MVEKMRQAVTTLNSENKTLREENDFIQSAAMAERESLSKTTRDYEGKFENLRLVIDACRAKLARTRKVIVGNKTLLVKIFDSNDALVRELHEQHQRYTLNELEEGHSPQDKENSNETNLPGTSREKKPGKSCASERIDAARHMISELIARTSEQNHDLNK